MTNQSTSAISLCLLAILALVLVPDSAAAHASHDAAGGFQSGFLHPILGWDHVIAMLAVGLWGSFLGATAIWLLPVVFPLVMALGAVAGMMGIPLPFVEAGIALSGVVLGLLVLMKIRLGIAIAVTLVGIFALFHGHAHGAELPAGSNAYLFVIGFVIATGLVHMAGIAIGTLTRWPAGVVAVRSAGAVIAMVGMAYLFGYA